MILFFEPVYKEKIWGGEYWGISAHPNGESIIKNGRFKGETLSNLWEEQRDLFGDLKSDKFPLLIKTIEARDDLSVQVHPDDKYAKRYEAGELGKSESWYILDCKEDAEIIYGTNAESRNELNDMIDNNKWDELLRTIDIKKGDFFYIPSGTVHAIRSGSLILEIQQNSDTTYRLYDYDRKDAKGFKRELHIEKSKDVIDLSEKKGKIIPDLRKTGSSLNEKYLESDHFSVEKYKVRGSLKLENSKPFILIYVLKNTGKIVWGDEIYNIGEGDYLMISSQVDFFTLEGNVDLIMSYV